MSKLCFNKVVIGEVNNSSFGAEFNMVIKAGDINQDGFIDCVICGTNGKMVWLENNDEEGLWKQHLIDETKNIGCGGSLIDLTGNGFPDIIIGSDCSADEVFWYENPGNSQGKWVKRIIAKLGANKFHDTIIGDVTGDGKNALIFTNQYQKGGTTIFYVPLPQDPRVSPWPGLQIIASSVTEPNPYAGSYMQPEEGLAIGDLDGDGINELVSGTHWYKFVEGKWEQHKFASGYLATKCAIGDIDGDGRNEIVLSEGDPCIFKKTQGGKVSWFKPEQDITHMWKEHVLEDFLFDAHSLQLGDIFGNGKLDIFVAEVGKADQDRQYMEHSPRLIVFENDGRGSFTRRLIDEGTGTHDAMLVDLKNRGKLDIIGRPLHGNGLWNVYVWYNESK